MNKFHEVLTEQLSRESSFINDNGDLKKYIIIDAAYNINPRLIELLIEIDELKNKFFTEIKGHWVFNINLFVQYMENKNFLKDSYTRYKNKIGLNINGKFLNQLNEVSLVWPFKDCVLEGGQTKEDQKRPEIFFNELLAQDEIDQLFEPKVLTNWKRYTTDGEEKVTKLKTDKKGSIKENLIIKGNNLLALHSLLPRFEEKVKLIYIDPPYNTGNDSFGYNDNFNHSTWLTFMKNRLEVAKRLLARDGAIFIQIDHHQLAYLVALMDGKELFGIENKVQLISIKTASPAGFKTVNPGPIDVTEYLLFYTKNKKFFNFKKAYVPVDYDDNYKYVITNPDDNPDNWMLEHIRDTVYRLNDIEIGNNWHISNRNAKNKWGKYWKIIRNQLISAYALDNNKNVVSIRDPHKPTKELKELMNKSINDRDKIFVYSKTNLDENDENNNRQGYVINGGALSFYSNKVKKIDGSITPTELLTDFWKDLSWDGIAKEGGVKLKNGKKPEKLLKRIIEITTEKNDIVLDYHLGSGTTAAVAHKMERQYIGIEQLDYEKNDSTIRLQYVIGKQIKKDGEWIDTIDCDKSGISKAVNWQGGGDFIYCELKKYNQTFIEQIEEAKDSKELLTIWEEMKEHSFINYNIDIKKQDEQIEEFKKLTLKQQKEILLQILNKNQLYVNLSSIDDEDFKISDEDKKLTKEFYQLKEENKDSQMDTGL